MWMARSKRARRRCRPTPRRSPSSCAWSLQLQRLNLDDVAVGRPGDLGLEIFLFRRLLQQPEYAGVALLIELEKFPVRRHQPVPPARTLDRALPGVRRQIF